MVYGPKSCNHGSSSHIHPIRYFGTCLKGCVVVRNIFGPFCRIIGHCFQCHRIYQQTEIRHGLAASLKFASGIYLPTQSLPTALVLLHKFSLIL